VVAIALGAAVFPARVQSVSEAPAVRAATLSLPGLPSTAPEQTVTSLRPAPVPLTVAAPKVDADNVLLAADNTQQIVTALAQEQDGAAAPAEEVAASRESEQLPLFYRYDIQPGDTVSTIAERFGIDPQYILWNNIDVISDQNLLTVGLQLQIPSVEGIIHSVRVGETLSDIAALYEADPAEIIAFPANELPDPNLLREGSTILVPGGRIVPKPAPDVRPAADGTPSSSVESAPSSTGFIWPVVDLVTSYFGPDHPLGIDINAPYVPVVAAAAGQVVFAGGDPCCSYGLYVEISHGDGYSTLYAHLDSISVALGEFVEQGQVIGISGRTGHATGPHVHFEIVRDGVRLDPLLFLP
jgi:murein DD-endopeptidase MepM/ murein hydrolase activator NlpD